MPEKKCRAQMYVVGWRNARVRDGYWRVYSCWSAWYIVLHAYARRRLCVDSMPVVVVVVAADAAAAATAVAKVVLVVVAMI